MKNIKTSAFTLTELIVVITILAILGTIGFMSYGGLIQSARNSQRVSDTKMIDKALSLYNTTSAILPLPDNPIQIWYSGNLAWTQGVFGDTMIAEVKKITSIPEDPVYGTRYTYAVTNNRQKYSLGYAGEAGLFGKNTTPLINQGYALSSQGLKTQTLGTYRANDISLITQTGCTIISSPSIILSDIPSGGNLLNGGIYYYAYQDSPNIPYSYSGSIDTATASTETFQIFEMLNTCNVSTITELKLYIAKLATSYQAISHIKAFQELIFSSNTKEFQLTAANMLIENGITVVPSLLKELSSPDYYETFIDTFTDTSGVNITLHSPDNSIGGWNVEVGNAGDYTIQGNKLQKNNAIVSLITPDTLPMISSGNYTIGLTVENFGSGEISLYLRYTDSDNYYKITLSASGYILMRRTGGVDSIFQNINDPIVSGDTISFGIEDDTLIFSVDGIEKEHIVAGGVSGVGKPIIFLQNNGAQIDDYTLKYK